jgi:hypothetical protein
MESKEERRGLPPADRIPSAQRPKKKTKRRKSRGKKTKHKEEYREKDMWNPWVFLIVAKGISNCRLKMPPRQTDPSACASREA